MKIGIIGGGVVGRATARCYLEHCDEVMVYDHVPERSTASLHETNSCDIVFICLPEHRLDTFLNSVNHSDAFHQINYVLKSTVPIGTTRRLRDQYQLPNLVHSPEFLTARCAVTDAQTPARNIIGGQWTGDNQSTPCGNVLLDLYRTRFPGVPVHLMTSDESEAVKLITNAFFSVKISYFNEARSLCDALKLDWETVRAGVLSDGRVGSSHTQVPGPDGKRGFGGACLPKDLLHMSNALKEADLAQWMVTAAMIRNGGDREKT